MQNFSVYESLKDLTMNKNEEDISHFFDFNHLDEVIHKSSQQGSHIVISKFAVFLRFYASN